MEFIVLILKLALGFTFMLSGGAKVIHIQTTSKFVAGMGIFPERWGKIMGYSMPFIEIIVALLLCFTNPNAILTFLVGSVIMFFIVLNMKIVMENKEKPCFCFGRIMKTRLGIGGLYHYIYMLVLLLFVVFASRNISGYDLFIEYRFIEFIFIIIPAIGIFITGLIMRRMVDLSIDIKR